MAAAVDYRRVARRMARRHGIDPTLFARQIGAESGFNPRAVSPAGALGIAQIMPATARGWGVDPLKPRRALDAAAGAMASYVREFGSYEDALRAYNAGPGNVAASRGFRETNAYVAKIMRGQAGSGGSVAGAGGPQAPSAPSGVPMGSEGMLALLKALRAPKAQPTTGALTAPAHTAAAPLPQGYQAPASGGGPAPAGPSVDELLEAVRTQGGDVPGLSIPAPGQMSAGARGGRVVLDPRADRAGVATNPAVVAFARQISAIADVPVRIGTGTRHSRLTTSGRVSDHWGGNAGDIPATGRRLIRLGQAALIAAGMPEREARQQHGGLYNVGGAQIIFATDEGGNHWDHLHVRPPHRGRR